MPSVSPGRPPPPSVKNTIGRRNALGELEQAVLLAVVLHALRAGEDRVVVRDGDRPRRLRPEQLGVDGADAADQAVGRGVGDEVVEAAPAALGGDHDRAVLDERAVVDEVGDVLPGRAPAAGPGAGRRRRGGPRRGRRGGARALGEVGADHGRPGGRPPPRPSPASAASSSVVDRLQAHQQVARHHRPSRRPPCSSATRPDSVGRDVVVHLHRLDEQQHGARPAPRRRARPRATRSCPATGCGPLARLLLDWTGPDAGRWHPPTTNRSGSALERPLEVLGGAGQPVAELDLGLPVEVLAGQREVGLALRRVVDGQRFVRDRRRRAGDLDGRARRAGRS